MREPEPRDAAGFVVRGVARLRAGDAAGAAADLAAAVRLDPELTDAVAGRGPRAALGVARGLAEAFNDRAGARLAKWDFRGALTMSDVAAALEPGVWEFRLTRAHVHYHLRDSEAEADYRAAFALDPAAVARSAVGSVEEAARVNPKAALRDCDKHLKFNPADVVSLARRGLLRLFLGQPDEAEADFAEFRRLNPGGSGRLAAYVAEARRRLAATVTLTSDPGRPL